MNQDHIVQFEKPDLSTLVREHTVVDMHVHTQYSDGRSSVTQIAQRARELGIGVAITDHNAIGGAVEMDAISDVLSIPGIEITSREGTHLLVYFYDVENLKKFYQDDIIPFMGNNVMSSIALAMEEIIARARKHPCMIILPHPYCAAYTGVCNSYFPEDRLASILKRVDGVEVINSENLHKWNLKSALLGFNLAKGVTAGSDGHQLDHVGNAVCFAKCRADRKAFMAAVKNRRNRVMGKEMAILRKVTSNSAKLKTTINNYPEMLEKNIKYGKVVLNNKSKRLWYAIRFNAAVEMKKNLLRWLLASSWMRLNQNVALLLILPLLS